MSSSRPSANIAFVSSPLSPEGEEGRESFDFFAIMLGGIVQHAQKSNFNVTVFIPRKKGPNGSDQADVLRRALAGAGHFHAIVIAPFDTSVVANELKTFLQKPEISQLGKLPIVVVDKKIDFTTFKVPANVIFKNVFCDSLQGGREAAEILHLHFRERSIPIQNRKFMVIPGLEGSESRVRGFKEKINEHYPTASVIEPSSPYLNFTRAGARRWMDDQFNMLFESARDKKRAVSPPPHSTQSSVFETLDSPNAWGIFACNDEMALGIRSVISNQYRQIRERLAEATHATNERVDYLGDIDVDYRSLLFLQDIKIVGFDGISPALDLIQPREEDIENDRWLIGTVGAQVDRQTEEAIRWIEQIQKDSLLQPDPEQPVEIRTYRPTGNFRPIRRTRLYGG